MRQLIFLHAIMTKQISISQYFDQGLTLPIIDVRSPAEYAKAHIPGAYNVALFSNEERAAVGTTYKQQSREAAILLAFDITGPKWSGYINACLQIAPQKEIVLHCWRGGMRSAAMAWALSMYGFTVHIISGGYKQYRAWVRAQFEKQYLLYVLGGMTGVGKTEVLQHLLQRQNQVIDLEKLACHQGSAYGSMNKWVQPSQEQFENNLAKDLYHCNPQLPLWIEDESQMIGRCCIPLSLWQQMRSSPLIVMHLPIDIRVERLMAEYAVLNKDFLIECTQRISKRLGPRETRDAITAIRAGEMEHFIRLVLYYYDKQYSKGMSRRNAAMIFELEMEQNDGKAHAIQLQQWIAAGIPYKKENT